MPKVHSPSVAAEWGRIAVSDGVELAYTERGSGPPVVFVPGWTLSGEVFEHQLAGIAARHRVITFDPRSHGRSTMTRKGNSYSQQGRDLLAVVGALDLTGIHLFGWSYGALACYAAIDQGGTDRVRSLTVLDETPKPLGTGASGEWAEMDLEEFLDGFVTPGVADPEAFAVEFVGWLTQRSLAPSERRWLEAMHLSTPRDAAVSLLASAMFSDYRELARSIDSRIPFANVIRSDWLDEATPWLSANAPHAVVWSMTSHLGFWESPADFNERLIAFFENGR